MKLTRLLTLSIFVFICLSLKAQKEEKLIWLKSGNLKTSYNLTPTFIDDFNKELKQLGNKSIALLHFEQLPSETDRKILTAAGIEILAYIPDNAYTIFITAPINIGLLQRVQAKAILPLQPEQKMDEDLSKNKFPAHAVKVAGTLDVRIKYPKNH